MINIKGKRRMYIYKLFLHEHSLRAPIRGCFSGEFYVEWSFTLRNQTSTALIEEPLFILGFIKVGNRQYMENLFLCLWKFSQLKKYHSVYSNSQLIFQTCRCLECVLVYYNGWSLAFRNNMVPLRWKSDVAEAE
jgi:hypothetical protein